LLFFFRLAFEEHLLVDHHSLVRHAHLIRLSFTMSFAAAVLKARVAVRALTTPTKPNPYVGGLGVATSPVLHSAAAGPAPPANSINKADLIKTVAEEHKLSQAQSKRIIDTVIGTISEVRRPIVP
jgi:hypothetical protein